jgi:ferredoxin-NADP reductase
MAMLRHRAARSSTVDARLLLSARSQEDVSYRHELATLARGEGLAVHETLTRDATVGWLRLRGRIEAAMLRRVGPGPSQRPRVFVCGPTSFVERAADLLVAIGHDPGAIRAERFGRTGG